MHRKNKISIEIEKNFEMHHLTIAQYFRMSKSICFAHKIHLLTFFSITETRAFSTIQSNVFSFFWEFYRPKNELNSFRFHLENENREKEKKNHDRFSFFSSSFELWNDSYSN